jgi:predicted RND superfamily exporter protein
MLTVLPTILFVVGMSDSVHVLTKYMQELRKGKEKIEAIRYAFKSIRLATFLTALTTAIGFFTLVFSNIQPISDFGIYTAVGVLLAYGLTYTLLPAILILGKPKRMNDFAMSDDFWTSKLHNGFMWVLRNRKLIWIGGIVILGLSAWGVSTIVVDNKMLEDLKDDHVLKQEFSFMEKEFAGCRPFELGIVMPNDSAIQSVKVLKQLDTLESYLRNEYGVGAMLGYAQLVKEANKTLNFGMEEYYVIPDSLKEIRAIEELLQQGPIARATGMAYNDSTRTLRISGKVGDIGRLHFDSCNQKLIAFMDQNCPDLSNRKITGTAHLIDVNNRSLIENTVWDLLISVLVIGIIMGIVYKSWRMIPLTILPNLFPLLIVAGIMGFTGIPLKVSTSIIFNIAFGIAVDDTIHFLARVRSLLGEGLSVNYAVKRTFLTTGKAMIVTTLILSGGFLTLIFSDFLGTHYIGLLVSLTLFIALFAELLFSPLIVMFFFKKR